MVPIMSLLNAPQKPDDVTSNEHDSPASPRRSPKKQKVDQGASTLAPTEGVMTYRPCEFRNEEIAKQHGLFQLQPRERIIEKCRTIPYSSDRRSSLKKIGRDCLCVCSYTFTHGPREEGGKIREYTVMWDYDIGLVQMTQLFKIFAFPKQQPARMLKRNPGLKVISHNLTGGSISAQGYWIPFKAAKAVAATFCYDVRYALTPIFGTDFISLCLPAEDSGFKSMIVDPKTLQECVEDYAKLQKRASLNCGSYKKRAINPEGEHTAAADCIDKRLSSFQILTAAQRTIDGQEQMTSQCLEQHNIPANATLQNPQPQRELSVNQSQTRKRRLTSADEDSYLADASIEPSTTSSVPPRRERRRRRAVSEIQAALTLMQLSRGEIGKSRE